MHCLIGHILVAEQHAALIGGHQTGDDIKTGRLTCAVGSQQTNDLALVEMQRDSIDHGASTIAFDEVFGGKVRHRGQQGWAISRAPQSRSGRAVCLRRRPRP